MTFFSYSHGSQVLLGYAADMEILTGGVDMTDMTDTLHHYSCTLNTGLSCLYWNVFTLGNRKEGFSLRVKLPFAELKLLLMPIKRE